MSQNRFPEGGAAFVARGASYVLVCTKTLAPHAIAFGADFFHAIAFKKSGGKDYGADE